MLRAIMMTWLTPTMSSGRAEGTSTRQSSWRFVQPAMRPKSCSSLGTCVSDKVVARTMGGTAKIRVASMAETGLLPKKISIGTR